MEKFLFELFGQVFYIREFNVSRVDIAADVESFPVENFLSILHIRGINSDTLSSYKGTIYAGFNPKIRIYDKIKEISTFEKEKRDHSEGERAS